MDFTFTLRCRILSDRLERTSGFSWVSKISWVYPAGEPPSLIRKWRTAGEPLLAHAFATFIHFCESVPPSPLVSRALARGSARCLRLAKRVRTRVRAHGNLGLAGVCARVGRPAAGDVISSRTRYPRACPRPVARETVINKVYYASATRHRDATTALSLSATGRDTRESLSRRGGSFCEK